MLIFESFPMIFTVMPACFLQLKQRSPRSHLKNLAKIKEGIIIVRDKMKVSASRHSILKNKISAKGKQEEV